ncbi:MAG TPA: hypothetical protein VKE41_13060, partial [Roseiflexaceae bacterium]|nr:hypothetical protein [Roseiflexaceae bacterium]
MKQVLHCIALLLLLAGIAGVAPARAQEQSPADQVRGLIHHAEEGIEAAERNQPEIMRGEYAEIHAIWKSLEDQVRERDTEGYAEIEGALAAIKAAVEAQPLDPSLVKAAYAHLKDEADEVADRLGSATAAPTGAARAVSLPEALESLDAADAAFARGDTAAAAEQTASFIRAWPSIEGAVATKSRDAYTAVEAEIGSARAALDAQ